MRAGFRVAVYIGAGLGTLGAPLPASADEVLDWNAVACRAVVTAPAAPPPLAARITSSGRGATPHRR